jgi:TolB protein
VLDIGPCLSSDDTKIAFEPRYDENTEIYIMNADGSNQINLTKTYTWEGYPSWGP